MNYKTIILCILILSCNQQVEDRVDLQNNSLSKRKPIPEFLNTLPSDTLQVELQGEPFCLNYNLDSLSTLERIDHLELIDTRNSLWLVSWHPLLRGLKVNKIAVNKFEFVGDALFPTSGGDWNIPFERHQIIRYILEIQKDSYRVFRDQSIRLNLPFDEAKLLKLEKYIYENKHCTSEDWDLVGDCFDEVERYEYQLFAALLAGHLEYKGKYANLQDSISIANAGEFAEYFAGNTILLVLYGVLGKEEAGYSDRMRLGRDELREKHCY